MIIMMRFRIDEQGHQLGSIRVAHNPEGLSQSDTYLERMAGPGGREGIACIVETTHGLLIAHLREQGWPVYPVNPRTVEKRRAPSGAKTNTIYAYLLAKTVRADFHDLHLSPRQRADPRAQDPHARPGCLDPDTNAPGQPAHRLPQSVLPGRSGSLRQAAPALDARVLARLSDAASRSRRLGGGGDCCAQAGQISWCQPESTADRQAPPTALPAGFRGYHADQIAADAGLGKPVGALLKQIAEYDKEIERLFLIHADSELFSTLPGVERVLLLACWPKWVMIAADTRTQAVCKPWPAHRPSFFRAGRTRKRIVGWGASSPAQCLAPICLAKHPPGSLGQGVLPTQEAEGKSHTVAVRALATVWARILDAVWKTKQPYHTATFEAARRAHALRQPAA